MEWQEREFYALINHQIDSINQVILEDYENKRTIKNRIK